MTISRPEGMIVADFARGEEHYVVVWGEKVDLAPTHHGLVVESRVMVLKVAKDVMGTEYLRDPGTIAREYALEELARALAEAKGCP